MDEEEANVVAIDKALTLLPLEALSDPALLSSECLSLCWANFLKTRDITLQK